ncbi:MAG: AAA family ATPase [Proteobacteria bacterium]|nr:AAA family ATPase [Pseudomonadota bacterium]
MPGIDELLPEIGFTLHKLLGINPVKKEVLYNRSRFIPADLVILDEASMIDARMMSLLFDALSDSCTLLLVGDKDQLPSVEAGAVFGDIVTDSELKNHRLKESVVILDKSWRSASGILNIAKEVIEGNGKEALELLKEGGDDISYGDIPPIENIVMRITEAYNLQSFAGPGRKFGSLKNGTFADSGILEKIFTAFEDFAVLIPSRKGLYGVENINRLINTKICGKDKLLYHGQPIMIRANDYNLSLFNGDRGVILNFGGDFYALFRDGHRSFRYIPAGKLSGYDTAYAQTIHKSQGSEFSDVMILIPEGAERLLTREIIYTGITRAKNKFILLSPEKRFCDAVSRGIVRHSGIREYLGGKNEA